MPEVSKKVIALDWDDTLVESFAQKAAQWQVIVRQLDDRELDTEFIRASWTLPFPELRDTLCQIDPDDDVKRARVDQLIENTYADFPKRPFADTDGFLRWARMRKIQLALVTSVKRDLLKKDFTKTGIPPSTFALPGGDEAIYTADDTQFHKPDGEVFDDLLDNLARRELSPREVLYVGDATTDYRAAYAAGLDFIAVTTGPSTHGDFSDPYKLEHTPPLNKDRIIQDIGQIPRKLERLGWIA